MPSSDDDRLILQPTQRQIYEALANRPGNVAAYYQAAVAVINDSGLPDRFALAAHALRELMEKLPNEVGAVQMGPDLNTRVNDLQGPWRAVLREEEVHGRQRWSNGVGAVLREFLQLIEQFFEGRENIVMGRRAQTTQFLNQLDTALIRLPEDVQRTNVGHWMRLRKYFNDVAHHQFIPEEDAFRERVLQLEVFLSPRLAPRPTADIAAIDALLAEEDNA